MIIHHHTVRLTPETQELYIIPIGDMQGKPEQERLRDLVEWCQRKIDAGHEVLLFGTGDYFETFSPSERAALAAAKGGFGLHETTLEAMDQWILEQVKEVGDILAPLRGRVLGLCKGHHFYHFAFGDRSMTTDQWLAEYLEGQYYGTVALIDLAINGLTFQIFATHGFGSARTVGAKMAKRTRMREVYLTANWYVMGHDNEKSVITTEAFRTDPNSSDGLEYFKQYFSGVGSFQRGYSIGKTEGGYVEAALYPPAALGIVICTVKVGTRHGRPRLDYHVSS